MSNSIYVSLNEIFDVSGEQLSIDDIITTFAEINAENSQTIIAKRIQYAFNKDRNGKNFWENFFYCKYDNKKSNDKESVVVFLFTKQQLVLLQYWWNQTMLNSNDLIKTNLTESKNNFFENKTKYLIINEKKRLIESLYVYYVDNDIASLKKPNILRLLFNKSQVIKKNKAGMGIDFFADDICETYKQEIKCFDITEQRKELNRIIINIKEKIEQKISKEIIIDYKLGNKWLLYLSKIIYHDISHEWISYCEENKIEHKCPLAQYVLA